MGFSQIDINNLNYGEKGAMSVTVFYFHIFKKRQTKCIKLLVAA